MINRQAREREREKEEKKPSSYQEIGMFTLL
jgi:hypothetical protein